ncbi:hypothetical protein JAAARDRAFT_320923 [Jaapia argillacea MUCL 33604]|uniref:Uncharacterized protein n=1 Tax=Jaapia argillacea MUCL 33604 TaxID=933084 RepID=A0A067PQL4_9AGAM|nr:hypothetical protein JAAARDRAFT_320923 [Jaapia argillacea MUCL 33604]
MGYHNTYLHCARYVLGSPLHGYTTWHFDRISSRVPASASKVVMQFRAYALYNRAKWVLALTFTVFIFQMATSLAVLAKYREDVAGTWISMMVFEGILLFLALYKTVLHLLRLNHPWTRNGAVEVLVRDSILYFLVMFSIECLAVIAWFTLPMAWIGILATLGVTATCTLGCRLILNIREVSYRHEQCVNTEEIEFQLRQLADGIHRGDFSSGVDPAEISARGRHDDGGYERGEEGSRQDVA